MFSLALLLVVGDFEDGSTLYGMLLAGAYEILGITVFRDEHFDRFKLLEDSKIISWQWFLYKRRIKFVTFFSSWCTNPLVCFNLDS